MIHQHIDPPYWAWDEVEDAVKQATGRDMRDWAGRWAATDDPNDEGRPYQDFWHILIESIDFHNGAAYDLDVREVAALHPDKPWVREVCDAVIAVIGPGEQRVKMEW
jgi:hypothetical protein